MYGKQYSLLLLYYNFFLFLCFAFPNFILDTTLHFFIIMLSLQPRVACKRLPLSDKAANCTSIILSLPWNASVVQ